MKIKKAVGYISVLVCLVLLIFVGYGGFKYFTNEPPTIEINRARESLASAKKEHAGKYAGTELKEAESLFNQAMDEWKIQNEKFFMFRDYSLTRELSVKSTKSSIYAKDEAGKVKNKFELRVEKELQKAKVQIARFDKNYKNLPIGRVNLDLYNQGKIKYTEAQQEFGKNDLKKALLLITQAGEKLVKAERSVQSRLAYFYNDYPVWQKNAQRALTLSKKGQVVILINKMEATFTILKSGKVVKTFNAEFGSNWMGDKTMQGDKATPEGNYKIVEKKRGPNTKYHKALLLDYPNSDDKIRFIQSVKSGQISKNTKIGGLIEIHGEGGKGIHWTDGCIALENKEMDSIYELCKINTPVIIIGAVKPLAEYLN